MMYEGLFLNGKLNGNGILKDTNGDKHVGCFKDGEKHGLGMYFGHDGIKWEINYDMGKKNGPATILFPDNSKMEFAWKDDRVESDIIYKNKE